ncbi:AmmeMemoRadiSam system protein B [Marinobacter panjinensis]|uniref:MEMO1 family protein FDP08_07570 n=1 Tax=Marinobacter panjinensis TaxID=2576384 RepID=A0A4U6R6N1_9GAMM|nr:AmmeMemoRadiSam system protein B [Marinobacter panjinensis]MCR8913364.1 AmmeMemoRadiSam system protein B [Marinobacter panjinensis]TKV67966.1 AmmeMemoRadiSam system protein B [Marinobacter panjinensis]
MSGNIRKAAVAGMFYPDDPAQLRAVVDGFLSQVPVEGPAPKAIIVPHAGYQFSGPVAASAYAQLAPLRDRIHRVVLLGPSHRVPLRGIAAPTWDFFETPLGNVEVDQGTLARLQSLPQVGYLDSPHQLEHSLEVHLPFLQSVFERFTLVPLVVGETSPGEVSEVLETLWGGDETLIVVSSDLSHYHSYPVAKELDSNTTRNIETLDYRHIGYDDACGRNPVNGLLYLAEKRGLKVTTLDLRNSGDTAGPRDRVVGYGAYAITLGTGEKHVAIDRDAVDMS